VAATLRFATTLQASRIQSPGSASLRYVRPDTLTSLNNLAATRWALGDAEGARQLLEQVVGISCRVLGERHPNARTFAANLDAVLEKRPKAEATPRRS